MENTIYLHRNEAKPYHIDYVLASSDLLPICNFEIGKINDWLSISEHMPICLTINS